MADYLGQYDYAIAAILTMIPVQITPYVFTGNSAGQLGKSYPLCPYCYAHPPKFGVKEVKGGGSSSEKVRAW